MDRVVPREKNGSSGVNYIQSNIENNSASRSAARGLRKINRERERGVIYSYMTWRRGITMWGLRGRRCPAWNPASWSPSSSPRIIPPRPVDLDLLLSDWARRHPRGRGSLSSGSGGYSFEKTEAVGRERARIYWQQRDCGCCGCACGREGVRSWGGARCRQTRDRTSDMHARTVQSLALVQRGEVWLRSLHMLEKKLDNLPKSLKKGVI